MSELVKLHMPQHRAEVLRQAYIDEPAEAAKPLDKATAQEFLSLAKKIDQASNGGLGWLPARQKGWGGAPALC